jgi:hypothetical protein
MAERYAVVYHVVDTRTGDRMCDDQLHVILMSDTELEINGLIKEKLKIAGRTIGKALLTILKEHVTDIKGRRAE